MTSRFYVRPAADRDLDDQAAYLAREANLATALRFYDAAGATFEHIARMPGIGGRRASVNPRLAGLRVWHVEGFRKHLIFYWPSTGGIEVVRVLHRARDIDQSLAGEGGTDE